MLQHLQQEIVGQDHVLGRLALVATRHLLGPRATERLVLIGPTGSGKSTSLRALAEAMNLPFLHLDASTLAETNWSGFDLGHALQALRDRCDSVHAMDRSIIIVDEIDKLGTVGQGIQRPGSTGDEYRRGKQESLLALWAGDLSVPYGRGQQRTESWAARDALIVGSGVFEGLEGDPPSPEAVVEWGLIPELVGRLGPMIRMSPPVEADIVRLLRREASRVAAEGTRYGVELRFTGPALDGLARDVCRADRSLSTRSAFSLIRDVADRSLAGSLCSPGTSELVITRIPVPSPPHRRRPGFRSSTEPAVPN